jgi:alpha-tubulin suppressor-like RCC1 family protein
MSRPHRAAVRPLRVALLAAAWLAGGAAWAQTYFWPSPRPPVIIVPPPLPADTLQQISAGAHHTCAVRADGGVLCWGNNESGQLGIGSNADCGFSCAKQPTRVNSTLTGAAFTGTRKVSGGEHHTCSLDRAGRAFCWGYNLENQTGTIAPGPSSHQQVWRPLPVATGATFTDISAGTGLSCAVNPAETTCWGNVGRLVGSSRTAFPEAIPRSAGYQAVSAGFEHVCMQTSVSGYTDVNCLGRNQFGQTTHDPAELPLLVDGGQPVMLGTHFPRAAGAPATRHMFTCADHIGSGTVQCAGANWWGWLGNGTNVASAKPVQVGPAGFRLSGVTVGWYHACAIDPLQQAWCWGDGYGGKLGNGSYFTSWTPVLVGGGNIKFRALAAGQYHTCGISTTNQIFCWGMNDRAQFGRGDVGGWHWLPQQAAPVRL